MDKKQAGFLSCGLVCTMESCVWMDKGVHVDGSELVLVLMAASLASLGAFDWWIGTTYTLQTTNSKVVLTLSPVIT